MIELALAVVSPTVTPNIAPVDGIANELIKAVLSDNNKEMIKGLFSEQMKDMVIQAPSDTYLIYVFLIIAVVLVAAMIIMLKISSGSAGKAITESVTPYIEQLSNFQKAFEKSQESYDKMNDRFVLLTEELIRYQTLRTAEGDMFEVILRQFNEMQNRVSDNVNNTLVAFREHEKNSYERHVDLIKNCYITKMQLLEVKTILRLYYNLDGDEDIEMDS